jgi:hypothetical protein
MEKMAEFAHSPTKNPISLILSQYTKKYRAYLFTYNHGLVRLPAKTAAEEERR